jgi:integrative and conjugative element protein (TIGR02256 family)
VRHPHEHRQELNRFFERTGSDYKRFNYLGEWHSHPSFLPVPSETDLETMQSIVEDPQVGANFLVLMIVKLHGRREMQVSTTAFLPRLGPRVVDIEFEVGGEIEEKEDEGFFTWVRGLFRR